MAEPPSMVAGASPRDDACSVSRRGLGCSFRSLSRRDSAAGQRAISCRSNSLHETARRVAAGKHCAPRSVSRFLLGSRQCVRHLSHVRLEETPCDR